MLSVGIGTVGTRAEIVRRVADVMAQDPRLRIVQAQRRHVGTDASAQRRRNGAKQVTSIELRHHRVGDIEEQIELIPLALQDGQQIR